MSTFKRVVERMLDLQLALDNATSACNSASRREGSLRARLNDAEQQITLLQTNLANLNAKLEEERVAALTNQRTYLKELYE